MISVVVNVYNGEKYIKKCLDSITNQTYKDLEILVINDGSTDDTERVVKSFKDKRIRLINQKNMGLSLSRNVAIEKFKGDYIFFVDSDDFIEKDTIEYLYNLSIKNNSLLTMCQSLDIFDYNYKVPNIKKEEQIITGLDLLKKILLFKGRYGNFWGKLIKRDFIKKYRFEDRRVDDVAIIYKMVLDLDKIVYSNQIKYYYLRHDSSALAKVNVDYCIDYYKASLERYDYIKERYPKLIENDICILWSIVTLYGHRNKEINDFLDSQNAKYLFKKMFTLRIINSNLRNNDKIKILLFRISPKLYSFIISRYLKHKSR